MANDGKSRPLVVLMLAAISAVVVAATLLANFVRWMFTCRHRCGLSHLGKLLDPPTPTVKWVMVAKAAGLPRRWPWYLVGAGAVLWGFAASLWLRGFDGPDVVYPYESVTNDLWNVGSAMLAFGLGAIAGRAINPRRTVAPKRVV